MKLSIQGLCCISLITLVLTVGCNSPAANTGGTAGANSTASTVTVIEQKIKADSKMAGADIKVTEQGGNIVLEGTVKSPDQKDTATSIVVAAQKEKKQQQGVVDNTLVAESGAPQGGK